MPRPLQLTAPNTPVIDLLYHLAFATTLIGTRLISGGKQYGWWLRSSADALFLLGGFLSGMSSFLTWSAVLLYMDLSAAIRSSSRKTSD